MKDLHERIEDLIDVMFWLWVLNMIGMGIFTWLIINTLEKSCGG